MTATPPSAPVFLYKAEAIETTMSTRGNHCLLRALAFDRAPADKKDAAAMRRLRERIAEAVLDRRDLELNGKTLEAWVEADAPGMRIDTWAEEYKTTDMMSDQIVLRVWPLLEGEAVWVWLPVASAGYELLPAYRFAAPPGARGGVRHVVYRADELHYNALTVQPAVLRRAEARAAASSRPVGAIDAGGCEKASKRRTSPPPRASTPTNRFAILDHMPRIDASVDVPPTMTLPPPRPRPAVGLSRTLLKRCRRRLRNTVALATLERRACRARVADVLCRWRARTWHAPPAFRWRANGTAQLEPLASRRAVMWRSADVRLTRTDALEQWGTAAADSQRELMSRLRICLRRWMEVLVLVKPLRGSTRQLALPRRATFATLAARLHARDALPEALLRVKHNGKLLLPGAEVRLRRDDELRVELRAPLRGGMQRDDHGVQRSQDGSRLSVGMDGDGTQTERARSRGVGAAPTGLPRKADISVGARVFVEVTRGNPLVVGIVSELLSPRESHPHGIKVRLETGVKGRVKELVGESPAKKHRLQALPADELPADELRRHVKSIVDNGDLDEFTSPIVRTELEKPQMFGSRHGPLKAHKQQIDQEIAIAVQDGIARLDAGNSLQALAREANVQVGEDATSKDIMVALAIKLDEEAPSDDAAVAGGNEETIPWNLHGYARRSLEKLSVPRLKVLCKKRGIFVAKKAQGKTCIKELLKFKRKPTPEPSGDGGNEVGDDAGDEPADDEAVEWATAADDGVDDGDEQEDEGADAVVKDAGEEEFAVLDKVYVHGVSRRRGRIKAIGTDEHEGEVKVYIPFEGAAQWHNKSLLRKAAGPGPAGSSEEASASAAAPKRKGKEKMGPDMQPAAKKLKTAEAAVPMTVATPSEPSLGSGGSFEGLDDDQRDVVLKMIKCFRTTNEGKRRVEAEAARLKEENELLKKELREKDSLLHQAVEHVEKLKAGKGMGTADEKKAHAKIKKAAEPLKGYMKKAEYQKRLVELGLIKKNKGKPQEGQHVFHIIAVANGGPDHVDNYLYALGGTFNITIGDKFDHLNCYLAGKEKARLAVDIAQKTAGDSTLHEKIELRDKKKGRVLYTDGMHKGKTSDDLFGAGQSLFTRSVLATGRADRNAS